MFATTILFTSILAGFAAAQSNTTSFDANSVDLSTRNQWCTSEQNVCPLLCGGQSNTAMNTCAGSSLKYECTCSNKSAPASIDQYVGSLPNYICEANFKQCRFVTPGSDSCKQCGTLQPTDVQAVATSTSSSAMASSTNAGSSSMMSSSSKAGAPTPAARLENAVGIGGMALLGALLL